MGDLGFSFVCEYRGVKYFILTKGEVFEYADNRIRGKVLQR